MLIDPNLQKQLETLPTGRRRPGRAEDEGVRLPLPPWHLARKNEGRLRSRLERLFARLFVPYDIELNLLLDASQAMTFSGFSPPVASGKFDYARRLAAAIAYAGLLRYERVRVTGFAPARGARAPSLQGRESLPALTDYLEGLRPGGNASFAAALRNALARGDERSVFVILSDFSDNNWDRGLQALMHGTSRIVLLQIYDPSEVDAVGEDVLGLLESATGQFRSLDETQERQRWRLRAAEELRTRLGEIARQNDLEHFPLATDTPFAEPLVRALETPSPRG
jgi:uncharacterized protein (DUF58 family)